MAKTKTTPIPAWGYRIRPDDGSVESKIFADGKLPRGWRDTPAKLKAELASDADADV